MAIKTDDTPDEAITFLLALPRLTFGDAKQIEALELLRLAEELMDEPPHECSACDGFGETDGGQCDSCGASCDHCGGECRACKGVGEVTWSRDDVYAMRGTKIAELLDKKSFEVAA